jgi:hypothetical protein
MAVFVTLTDILNFQDDLLICGGDPACQRAKHLGCFDPPLTCTPVDGFICDQCEESRPARPQKRVKKLVIHSDLIEFGAQVLSNTTEGVNAALGQMKDNVASLPDKKEYIEMSAEEQAEVEQSSLIFTFLEKSPGCKEIFDEMDDAHSSTNMFMILAELLHVILENNYFLRTIGSNFTLCKQIVRLQVPKMNALFETVKTGPTMASLLLLRTVAKTSQSAASDLVAALNLATFGSLFSHGIVYLKRTHQELASCWDEPLAEVRVFAAKVVFALLRVADTRLKDFMLGRDEKNARFVSSAFSRLTTYNRETVLEALDVLRNNVLRDRSVMRRVKTNFFSSALLGDLGMLIHRFHDPRVVEFVEYIATDHFSGVVIPEEIWIPEDNSSAERHEEEEQNQTNNNFNNNNNNNNNNKQVTCWSSNVRFLGLLNALRPWRSTVQRDLVLLVLAECPRLAPLYFGQSPDIYFCSQFFPKNCSSSWLCSMALVKKYVEEQAIPIPGPWINDSRAVELAERAVPGCPSLVQWRKCLVSDFALVRLVSLDTLHAILLRLQTQLDRHNRLVAMALDWVQVQRLPNANLIQLLISREKSDFKNAGSQMILGSALRCLNLYHSVFSSLQISDANWAGTLQSPWSRVPAIGQIAFTSHGWWQRGPAKDVFKMLVREEKNKSSQLLRSAVLRTAQSLLQDTDLFGNALFAGELDQWLVAIEQDSDADLLVSTVGRIMKAVPTAKHLEAKFNQELRQFASPLLLEMCGQLYQKSAAGQKSTGLGALPKFKYFCRAVFSLCHESVVPLNLLCDLLEALRKDDGLFSGSDGSECRAVISATGRYVSFLNKKSVVPENPGNPSVPGSVLPLKWWSNEAFLAELTESVILAHLVFMTDCPEACLAEELVVATVDDRLFCQAVFYVQQLRHLVGSSAERLCFRIIWAALERENVVSSALRQKLLQNRVFLEACVAKTSPDVAVLIVGECLISADNHSFAGSILLHPSTMLTKVAPVLRYLRWAQIDVVTVNDVLRRVIAAREWRLASLVVWSAWPGVSAVSSEWLERFRNYAIVGEVAAGSHNVVAPDNETIVAAMESLRVTRELDYVVLFWALLGVVAKPPLSLVNHLVAAAASTCAVSALLAIYARLFYDVASEIDSIVNTNSSVIVAVVPALCLSSRGVSDRYRSFTSTVIQAAVAEQLSCSWLIEWRTKVFCFDKKLFLESLPLSFSLPASVLCSSHELVGLSNLSYEEKLRLLLPVVAVSNPPAGSWKDVAGCLRELRHVAQWGDDDVSLKVLRVVLEFPNQEGYEALAEAVQDDRTDAGWVERACRELLSSDCKDVSLAQLLFVMVKRRPNLCTRDLLGRVMTFYSASCSRLDLVLLRIIRLCQRNGLELESVGSFWGRPETGTSFSGGAEHLLYEGALVKDAMLVNSIAEFPVERLEGGEEVVEEDLPGVYDPCFLLPYLHFALTRFEANCKRFADRGFLAYAIMGCSSAHEQVRRHAYSVIQAYWVLLEASPSFSWKPQVRLLILSFKNAIIRPFQFVPSLVTVFLANYALILCQPSHLMYEMINNALLRRPVMDLGTVPLLRDSFLGKCENGARRWFLQTLGQGLKRGVDLKLLQEFHVIELLQSFFHHVADLEERVLIFKILQNCTRNAHLGRMLDQKFGVLGWVSVSSETVLERQAAARLAAGLLSAWGKHASPQTRQLGWLIGAKLLSRATSAQQASHSLALLASCVGASSADAEVVLARALELGASVDAALKAVAASRSGEMTAIVIKCLTLLLDTGISAVSADTQTRVFEMTIVAVVVGKLNVPQNTAVRGVLRRVICVALLARDEIVLRQLGVLACAVMRHFEPLSVQLRTRFKTAVEKSDVTDMLVIFSQLL